MRSFTRSMGAAAVLETAAETPPTKCQLVSLNCDYPNWPDFQLHRTSGGGWQAHTQKVNDEPLLTKNFVSNSPKAQRPLQNTFQDANGPSRLFGISDHCSITRGQLNTQAGGRRTGIPRTDFSAWFTSPLAIVIDVKRELTKGKGLRGDWWRDEGQRIRDAFRRGWDEE